MPLIGEAHRDAVLSEGPNLLDQSVVKLAIPLARQESQDGLAAYKKLGAVSPDAVGRICESHAKGIAGVPSILGFAHLLDRSLERKGRQG